MTFPPAPEKPAQKHAFKTEAAFPVPQETITLSPNTAAPLLPNFVIKAGVISELVSPETPFSSKAENGDTPYLTSSLCITPFGIVLLSHTLTLGSRLLSFPSILPPPSTASSYTAEPCSITAFSHIIPPLHFVRSDKKAPLDITHS